MRKPIYDNTITKCGLPNRKKSYCYVFTFLKTFKYESSLIANKVLFMCPTVSNLYNVYNNNYNNNCLFDILLTQLFAILLTMEIFIPRLFSSHAARLHTIRTEFLLLVVCFVMS